MEDQPMSLILHLEGREPHRSCSHHTTPMRGLLFVATCCLLIPSPSASQVVKSNFWVVDGSVYATALQGNTLYIGGTFRHIGPVGGATLINGASGIPVGGFPRAHGYVNALAADGAGGWFVGGDFDSVGGLPRRNLARTPGAFTVSGWNPGADNQVWALVVYA